MSKFALFVVYGLAIFVLLSAIGGSGIFVFSRGSAQAAPAATPYAPLVVATPYAAQDDVTMAVVVFPDYTDSADDVAAVGEVGRQINARGKDGVVFACKEHSAVFHLGDVHDCVAILYFRRAQPK